MKHINVVISGQAGTGKSTICQLISNTLTENGFDNVKVFGEEGSTPKFIERFEDRLENMNKEDIAISLQTVQTARKNTSGQQEYHECLVCEGRGIVKYSSIVSEHKEK